MDQRRQHKTQNSETLGWKGKGTQYRTQAWEGFSKRTVAAPNPVHIDSPGSSEWLPKQNNKHKCGRGSCGKEGGQSERETGECWGKSVRMHYIHLGTILMGGFFKEKMKYRILLYFFVPNIYESVKCSSCLILAHSTYHSMKIKIVTWLNI